MPITIRKARGDEFDVCVEFLDSILPKEGFGFCNKMQVQTELKRGSVFVAEDAGKIIGIRIGLKTLFNLAVIKERRGEGIGKQLIDVYEPDIIRVKSCPKGHLSKSQLEFFVNPEPFYQKCGFVFASHDYGRNFYQNTSGTAKYHKKGKEKHIAIYRNKKQKGIDEFEETEGTKE